jgi:hypothetical protein
MRKINIDGFNKLKGRAVGGMSIYNVADDTNGYYIIYLTDLDRKKYTIKISKFVNQTTSSGPFLNTIINNKHTKYNIMLEDMRIMDDVLSWIFRRIKSGVLG